MELKLSRDPLMKNPSCAYCGNVFNAGGVHLELSADHRTVHFPVCRPCFDSIGRFEATVDLEQGLARARR